jgi:hypothetical protein
MRLVPWEQVAVAIEGDRDRGMAHVRTQGLRVDPGCDHERRVTVSALVQADRSQARSLPGRPDTKGDGAWAATRAFLVEGAQLPLRP